MPIKFNWIQLWILNWALSKRIDSKLKRPPWCHANDWQLEIFRFHLRETSSHVIRIQTAGERHLPGTIEGSKLVCLLAAVVAVFRSFVRRFHRSIRWWISKQARHSNSHSHIFIRRPEIRIHWFIYSPQFGTDQAKNWESPPRSSPFFSFITLEGEKKKRVLLGRKVACLSGSGKHTQKPLHTQRWQRI